MLKERIQSGLLFGAVFLAAVFVLPVWAILVMLLILAALALWEFYALLGASDMPHYRWVGAACGLALVAGTWFSLLHTRGLSLFGEWSVLFLSVAAVIVRQILWEESDRPLQRVAGTLLGVFYVAFLLNFITKLLMVWGDHAGRMLILYMVLVVKGSDIGAYFVGCTWGRRKLLPRVSPAKSWEGFAGGIATGIVVSVAVSLLFDGNLRGIPLTLLHAVALGVVLSVAGVVGDLSESLFKRAAGVKDSGRMVLGMGGVLDVLDSLLLAAPTLYIYARLFLA